MRLLRCLINVPDKNTRKEYKSGEIYEFNEERAEELLLARTKVSEEPYFTEYSVEQEITEEIVQSVCKSIVGLAKDDNKTIEEVVNEIIGESEEMEEDKEPENESSSEEEKTIEEVDLSKLKVDELKKLAKEKQIDGYEDMKKEQLIEALNSVENE